MLPRILSLLPVLLSLLGAASTPLAAQSGEPRIAFVVGNGGYPKGPLQTSLNDAGLVAEALRGAGFQIVEGADLNHADLMRAFREFLAKLETAGPDAVAFIYFSGYGFTSEGENYLAAADARLDRDGDIPLDAVRLTDLLRPLAGAPAHAKIVVLDASRRSPFAVSSAQPARGLAAIEPPPLVMVAYSAAPGTVAADGAGPYGAFAAAIAEMIREPGADVDAVFTRVRSRTHQLTDGRQTPWHISSLGAPVALVPAAAGADANAAADSPARASQPKVAIDAEEAYALAIEQDTLPLYVEFVESFPSHPYAARIWAIIRTRREALAWMRAIDLDTPAAYWTYLRRYPAGIYAADAQQRLRRLSAQAEPPANFTPVEFFDVPAPLPNEPARIAAVYPVAPPPPRVLIEPPSPVFASLPPPQARAGVLPTPAPLPAIPNVTPGARLPFGAPAAYAAPHAPAGGAVAPLPSGAMQPGAVPYRAAPATALAPTAAPRPGVPRQGMLVLPVPRPTPVTASAPVGAPPQVLHRPPPDIAVGTANTTGTGTASTAVTQRPPRVVSRPPPAGVVPAAGVLPARGVVRPAGVLPARTPPPATARAAAPLPTARLTPPAKPAQGTAAAPPSAVARVAQPPGVQRPATPRPPKRAPQQAQEQPLEKKCVVVDGKEVCI